ncbi:MAG: hypothetical protein KatS3mg076_1825 [Candidatus Binatia bacterium]|nr:MAG: hypothetical protein KatS3mg076_1825 [Candidatus Binatia bacterium]
MGSRRDVVKAEVAEPPERTGASRNGKTSLARKQERQRAVVSLVVFLCALVAPASPLLLGANAAEVLEGRVVEVYDGDTILVRTQRDTHKVRLVGIDTPELGREGRPAEFFAEEARTFARRRLLGRKVRLELDPAQRIDKYGRLLAYVRLEDGTLFNRELLVRGYARVYDRFPFAKAREFRLAELEARRRGLGIWANGPGPIRGPVVGNRRSRVYHDPRSPYAQKIAPRNRVEFRSEEEAIRAGYRRAWHDGRRRRKEPHSGGASSGGNGVRRGPGPRRPGTPS